MGGDVFSRPDDTPRSLARRVPEMECILSPSHSTASAFPRARSASVEPRLATATPARSCSVDRRFRYIGTYLRIVTFAALANTYALERKFSSAWDAIDRPKLVNRGLCEISSYFCSVLAADKGKEPSY